MVTVMMSNSQEELLFIVSLIMGLSDTSIISTADTLYKIWIGCSSHLVTLMMTMSCLIVQVRNGTYVPTEVVSSPLYTYNILTSIMPKDWLHQSLHTTILNYSLNLQYIVWHACSQSYYHPDHPTPAPDVFASPASAAVGNWMVW